MPSPQSNIFTCQACGHQFAGSREILSKQPTCPKCRTFGQLVDASGVSLSQRQTVVKIAHPGTGAKGGSKPAPYAGSGRAAQPAEPEEDAVQVSAAVAYGNNKNPKRMVNTIILVVIGIATVVVLYVLVSALKTDGEEAAKQRKETVLDVKDFEASIDKAIDRVRDRLRNVAGGHVQESTDFGEALREIQMAGGATVGWTTAPKPGAPLRAHGFVVRAEDKKNKKQLVGFVMLLYYKTAQEAENAAAEIRGQFPAGNSYSVYGNAEVWFVCYTGQNYTGEVFEALKDCRSMGQPRDFQQFMDRVGATYKGKVGD